jgi:GntR family transcriptional regulator, transcriptional repressor for pyruvate dehydrogenase complex
VEQQILSGRLKPGDRFPAETALAEQFGVNRSTVREGIRLLEHSGLVRRQGGKRLEVSLPHYRELASRASRALALHQITFRELWEASMAIEPLLARYATERITPAELEELETIIADMEKAKEDTARFVQLDVEFHNVLAKAAHNRALEMAREPLSLLFLPAGQTILPRLATHNRVIAAHREILAMVRSGDADGAHQWMTRHMEDFRRGYEKAGQRMDQTLEVPVP